MAAKMENRSEMEVKDVGKEIFLVKVPDAVLQLADQGKDGDLLGVFSAATGAARGQRYAFTIASRSGQLESAPGYDFRYEKNVRNTFVLGRRNGGRSAMRKITNKGTMRARMSSAMKDRLKKSTMAAARPMAKISVLSEDEVSQVDYYQQDATIRMETTKPPEQHGRSVAKREKLPRHELVNIISHMFMTQVAWSMKDMEQKTAQPTTYLKEVLMEMCNYLKSGPFKNHYILKEEHLPEGAPRLDPEQMS